jgi:hypothetical protein
MSTFGPASSSPLGRTGGPIGSPIPTTHHRSSSRPRRSMCNPPPRRLARRLLPLLTGTTARIPRVTTRMYHSVLKAGVQSPRPHHHHRVCSKAYPTVVLPQWYESPSALRGDNPWRRGRRGPWGWRRGGPWRRRGRSRLSRWSDGGTRHLIPFRVHTLDIRHVIPSLQRRCRGAAGLHATRTPQEEATPAANGCTGCSIPSSRPNECPSGRAYNRA